MSQPFDRTATAPPPGDLDPDLSEFWVESPWMINLKNNLSSFEPNRLFLSIEGKRFVELGYLSGTDSEGDARAVLAADLGNDGRLDLVVRQVGGGGLKIYENRFPAGNWLRVSLDAPTGNRQGIGSRLVAQVGDRRIHRDLWPVNSFRSQAPAEVHFGIGDADAIDRLEIHWPSGTKQALENIPANRHYQITEGEPVPHPIAIAP